MLLEQTLEGVRGVLDAAVGVMEETGGGSRSSIAITRASTTNEASMLSLIAQPTILRE